MNCQESQPYLTAYLLGDLASERAERLRLHLDHCADCQRQARQIEPTLSLLRAALAVDAAAEIPRTLDPARRNALLEIPPPRRESRVVQWVTTAHPRWRMAACVALVVTLGLSAFLLLTAVSVSSRMERSGAYMADNGLRIQRGVFTANTEREALSYESVWPRAGSDGRLAEADAPAEVFAKDEAKTSKLASDVASHAAAYGLYLRAGGDMDGDGRRRASADPPAPSDQPDHAQWFEYDAAATRPPASPRAKAESAPLATSSGETQDTPVRGSYTERLRTRRLAAEAQLDALKVTDGRDSSSDMGTVAPVTRGMAVPRPTATPAPDLAIHDDFAGRSVNDATVQAAARPEQPGATPGAGGGGAVPSEDGTKGWAYGTGRAGGSTPARHRAELVEGGETRVQEKTRETTLAKEQGSVVLGGSVVLWEDSLDDAAKAGNGTPVSGNADTYAEKKDLSGPASATRSFSQISAGLGGDEKRTPDTPPPAKGPSPVVGVGGIEWQNAGSTYADGSSLNGGALAATAKPELSKETTQTYFESVDVITSPLRQPSGEGKPLGLDLSDEYGAKRNNESLPGGTPGAPVPDDQPAPGQNINGDVDYELSRYTGVTTKSGAAAREPGRVDTLTTDSGSGTIPAPQSAITSELNASESLRRKALEQHRDVNGKLGEETAQGAAESTARNALFWKKKEALAQQIEPTREGMVKETKKRWLRKDYRNAEEGGQEKDNAPAELPVLGDRPVTGRLLLKAGETIIAGGLVDVDGDGLSDHWDADAKKDAAALSTTAAPATRETRGDALGDELASLSLEDRSEAEGERKRAGVADGTSTFTPLTVDAEAPEPGAPPVEEPPKPARPEEQEETLAVVDEEIAKDITVALGGLKRIVDPPPPPVAYAPAAHNAVIETADNAFSTFAIDVDTASYTLTRRAIRSGQRPDPETVRTEEIVNAFDYGDKAPEHSTFSIFTEGAPSPFGHGLTLLRVGVKGRRLGREEQRPAVLTFLVDTSGSMEQPDRIGLAQHALNLLIGQLSPRDQVAVVQYDAQARVVLEHTPASNAAAIRAAVDGLQCSGSTNLEEGMRQAYQLAAAAFLPGGENRVLILSDGVANLGSADADEILGQIDRHRRQGITCSVFGVGTGAYNDRMLESLANRGDGVYRFLDSRDEAERVFVQDLAATLNTIAADVKIQVEFDPGTVLRYRQLGYENRKLTKEQFRDDTVDAGEVGSGQSVTALYEIERSPDPAMSRRPLGTVRVRYRPIGSAAVREIEHPIAANAIAPRFEATRPQFQLAAAAAEFAEILRISPYATGSRMSDVARRLHPVALSLHLDARVRELLDLVEQAGD